MMFQIVDINVTVSCRQPLIAGMYLMMSVDTVIPPGEKGNSLLVFTIISLLDL